MKLRELKVGQYVTVSSWVPREGRTDRSWCGDVLEIRAINVPYIVFLVKRGSSFGNGVSTFIITLNLNEVTLMPLTDEYVNEALGIVTTGGKANDE